MRTILLALAIFLPLSAEVLDRIAITVNQQVITESQIDEEILVTSFLNRQPAQYTLNERREAADRLLQQYLVEREMKLAHYPPPTEAEVEKFVAGLENTFGGAQDFASALKQAHLNQATLRTHLNLQLTTLRFIEYRFRPNFEISDQEIDAYRKQQSKVVSREAIREILTQQRTDEILAAWLEETRKQVDIVYLDSTLEIR